MTLRQKISGHGGTLTAIEALKESGCCETEVETKRKIIEALDIAAHRLGNTSTVCRKYYVHPVVLDHYSNGTFAKFTELPETDECLTGLTNEEQMLMNMLERAQGIPVVLPVAI
jgi:DNA topoisomerase-1